ncbi:hypothetical protein [Actinomadura sp. B10D3]|uniref:hypothetical protein n=1 Tax=Actinomadura sp. B10D3 TaxID=3153557 RepID=UPI00325E16FB
MLPFRQRGQLVVQPTYKLFVSGGRAPVTIVAEDREDIQVLLTALSFGRMPKETRLIRVNGERLIIEGDSPRWGGPVMGITIRVPVGFDKLLEVHTRGMITAIGPVRNMSLTAGRSIEVEEITSASSANLSTYRAGSSVKVGKTSGELRVHTPGGRVRITADDPRLLRIDSWGGAVRLCGTWKEQAVKFGSNCGEKTLRNSA